jgi:putative two-component system response regulator
MFKPDANCKPAEGAPTPTVDYLAEGSSLAELASRLDALLRSYSQDVAQPEVGGVAHPETTSSVKRPAREIVAASVEDVVTKVPSRSTSLDYAIPLGNLPDDLRTAAIMIIDVEQDNIRAVQNVLRAEGYGTFITTTVPRDAMKLLRERKPDVLLLDIRMPDVTGIDILHAKRLDESLVHIPAIVMTATKDPVTKRQALDLGACDFLPKPLDPNDLIPRVRNALLVKKHHDQMVHQADRLEELIRRRTADLEESRRELVMSLARAAEHRDTETGNHVLRVGCYAGLLAGALGWPSAQIEILELAAPLHDVGKIGVPDHILFKPGKLDPDEFEIIKNHCVWGKEIIQPFSANETRALRSHTRRGGAILHIRGSAVLMMASRIAQTHHENWDGTGYPLGLAGEDIPLEGRIVAIADNFDALSTRRPYKRPFSRDECFRIMKQQREKKFDPRLLDMFFELSDKICQIQMELMDPTPQFGNLTEELPGPSMADEYSI